jgi:hypothetical protein
MEGLGGTALEGGVLQMVSELTLAVARKGQCVGIGRMARVGLRWDTRHGIWVGAGHTVVRYEGRFLDICSGQYAEICMRVWAWDGAHGMAYGSALDG